MLRRLTQAPPSVRAFRSDIPFELDQVVTRLMAIKPEDRYATPEAAMKALLGFLKTDSRGELWIPARPPANRFFPLSACLPRPAWLQSNQKTRMLDRLRLYRSLTNTTAPA